MRIRLARACLAATTLLCLSLLTAAYAATPQGAIVQSVNIKDNVASITVLNQAGKDITGFSVTLVAHFADGRTEPSEVTEDYGPLTGNVLATNQVKVVTETYQTSPAFVDAKVSVVIYKDGTAESSNPRSLHDNISVRAKFAKADRLTADTLKESLADSQPAEYVTNKLTAAKEADKTLDRVALDYTIKSVQLAAANGKEREVIQSEAERLDKEAKAFAAYANVKERQ